MIDAQGRPPIFTDKDPAQKGYIVDVLLRIASNSSIPRDRSASGIQPPPPGDKGEPAVIGVLLSTVTAISQFRINLPKDIRGLAERNTAFKAVEEVCRRMGESGPTLLDPVRNMGIQDKSFKELVKVSRSCMPQKRFR